MGPITAAVDGIGKATNWRDPDRKNPDPDPCKYEKKNII